MFLYILRHGEAKPKHEDPERGLTDLGKAEVRAVSRALALLNPRIEQIWHSGKTRAEQSAAIMAEQLRCAAKVEVHDKLSPNDPVEPLVGQLREMDTDTGIVGHLPHLGKLISALLLGRERNLLDLAAAGLVCLERSADSWLINWYLTPELCFKHES